MICGVAEVHSFGPMRVTYEILSKNIELNGLANVRTYNKALGSSEGYTDLLNYRGGNMGASTLGFGGTDYPVTTIDALHLQKVDFIKIDVEGAQIAVLEGARETIRRCKPRIWIEMRASRGEADEGRAVLSGMGYQEEVVLNSNNFIFSPFWALAKAC
jgi:FkbM family methyltransferase